MAHDLHGPHGPNDVHDHDLGLVADLPMLLRRRRMLGLLAGAGLVSLVGCGSNGGSSSAAASATSTATGSAATSGSAETSATASASCAEIPQETAGPYPGDGSNGPNVLAQSGVVRSDIRRSFGTASGVAEGVPLTIKLNVLDAGASCAALRGAAVYLWHCDREGRYSMYSQGVTGENYLRGVQETDDAGGVTFTSIFPAAYSGRWPHVHFEVYPSLAKAAASAERLTTSQLALPKDACDAVYATDGYSASIRNLAQTSLATDNVFRDGSAAQLATVTGSVSAGYVTTLSVPV
jgi:protocatechuate 3,4-dioxygenase beta subunit